MRRKGQELPFEETVAILRWATSGVLALVDDDGGPYAVPMSFAFEETGPLESEAGALCGRIWFHCAPEGRKLDAVAHETRASLCVISDDDVVPELLTTRYRSVMAFGRVRVVEDEEGHLRGLRALARKYAPGFDGVFERELADYGARTCVLEMAVERLTGKESRELMQERRASARPEAC